MGGIAKDQREEENRREREDCREGAVSELQGDAELAAAVLGQPERGGGEKERERNAARGGGEQYLSNTMTLC